MVQLKALFDTIDRFEKENLFIADTIYLNKYDFLFRPERIGYIIHMKQTTNSGEILFIGRNGSRYSSVRHLLTDEEHIIKNIIE